MKKVNREDILRMIGMRDSAGLMKKINSLMLDIYDENGVLAEYSTQLIITSKNITLLAQRVTDTETGIAELDVEYNNISATVSSLTTTVSGHTTQISSLQITTGNISASVSSLTTTVNGHTTQISSLRVDLNGVSATVTADHTTLGTHTTQIGQLQVMTTSISQSVSSISDEVDAIDGTVTTHTTQISTLRTDLNGVSATVTADHSTLGTHTTQIGALEVSANSISNRVTVIEGDYVKTAQLSLYVDKASVSWLTGSADNVIFNFTNKFQIQHSGTAVLNLTANGDLEITGTLKANSVIGTLTVDSNGNLSGNGSIVTNAVVAGYKSQEVTVPSTNNSTTTISAASGMFVFLKGTVTTNTHYFLLPTLSDIKSVLGISSTSVFFSIRIIILNQSSAEYCYLSYRTGTNATTNQPWKMSYDDTHYTGGDAVTQLAVGDYIEILLIYNPTVGEYRAYETVHNN